MVKAEIGGDGGNGGGGAGQGHGGLGGGGVQIGLAGKDGAKACVKENGGSVTPPPPPSNSSVTTVSWSQPQACPEYGSPNNCYGNTDDKCGGYDNWAKSCATFVWTLNPCKDGKKVVGVTSSNCTYETGPVVGQAQTSIQNGQVVVDCRKFAAQFRYGACTCNNGITLNATVECQ